MFLNHMPLVADHLLRLLHTQESRGAPKLCLSSVAAV